MSKTPEVWRPLETERQFSRAVLLTERIAVVIDNKFVVSILKKNSSRINLLIGHERSMPVAHLDSSSPSGVSGGKPPQERFGVSIEFLRKVPIYVGDYELLIPQRPKAGPLYVVIESVNPVNVREINASADFRKELAKVYKG